jgi:oligopeptide/dipeptide ABC transporter ATP-binding protein
MQGILSIQDLRIYYHERGRTVRAVDGCDLSLRPGETLAVVGESGCGKTTLALSILGLVARPGAIESGRIFFEGLDLLTLPPDELRRIRGRQVSMIFQDPVSGLNPVLSVGTQVEEIIRAHMPVSAGEARRMTQDALRAQGLPDARRAMDSYPFQLSGGMCQRVMIAIATVLKPRVIIADEPTSALDVTVQAAILAELEALKRTIGAAILLISHDLGVVAQMADRMAVMYAGRIVETGDAATLYARPSHPYTAALLAARPRPEAPGRRLASIRGAPPDLGALGPECAFLPRCSKALSVCRTQPWPALAETASGQHAACYNPMFYGERLPA